MRIIRNMNKQQKWEQEVREVFEQIKKHNKPYDVEIEGIKFTILPNVFSPKYFTDSAWFAKEVSKIVGSKKMLDIGTGIGIIAAFAAINGAKVFATDINPNAVQSARLNFEKLNLDIPVYKGDMFNPLPKDEKFDFIFWNHPFNKGDNIDEEILLQAGFDYQYHSLEKYIKGADKFLKKDGRLLLGTGNFADLDAVKYLAIKYGYEMILITSKRTPLAVQSFIDNEYRIYELKKL